MEKSSTVEYKRVSAIKELLKRERLTQQELAGRINVAKKGHPFKPMEAQNLSRALTQNRVSDKLARKIWELFSDKYRIEWLLGYDDIPTLSEWADNVGVEEAITSAGILGAFNTALKKKDKRIEFIHRNSENNDSSQGLQKLLQMDCYFSVQDKYGNELKRLSAKEMVELEQKVQEFCDFIADRYL